MASIPSFSLYYQLMNSCLRKLYCEKICLPDSPQLINRELHQTFYVDGNHSSIKMQALLDLRSVQMYTNLFDSWQHVDGTYQQAKPLHLGLFFDRFTVREDMSFLHPLFQPLCSCELFVRNDRFLFVQNDNTILYLQGARQIVCSHDPLSREHNVCDILDTIICNAVVETCFGYKQYFNYNEKPKSNGMLEKWKKMIHGGGYTTGKQKNNARADGSRQRCTKDAKGGSGKSAVKSNRSNSSAGRNAAKIKTDVVSTKNQQVETLKTNSFADGQVIVPDVNATVCNFSLPTSPPSPMSRNLGPIQKNSTHSSMNLGMQFPTLSAYIASNQHEPILQTAAYQQFVPHPTLQNVQLTQNALSQQYAMQHNGSFFREDPQRQSLLRSSPLSLTNNNGNGDTNTMISESKVIEIEKHITTNCAILTNFCTYCGSPLQIVDAFQQLHKQQEHFIQAQFQYGHQQQYHFQQHAQEQVIALPISVATSKKFTDRISLQQKPSFDHREQQDQKRFLFQQQQQPQPQLRQHNQPHPLSHQQEHQPPQIQEQQQSSLSVLQQSISPECVTKSQESEICGGPANRISVRTAKKNATASTVTVTQNTVSKFMESEKNELDYKGIVKRKVTNASFASSSTVNRSCRRYEENASATFVRRYDAMNTVQNICYFRKINFDSIGKSDYLPRTTAPWSKGGSSSSSSIVDGSGRFRQNSNNWNTNKIDFRPNKGAVPQQLININGSLTNAPRLHDVSRQPLVTSNATARPFYTSNLRADSFASDSGRTNNCRTNVRDYKVSVNEKRSGYIADRATTIPSNYRHKTQNVIFFLNLHGF